MKNIVAGSVQFESVQADKTRNLEIVERFTKEAAGRGVQVLAFPECCLTGYWFIRNLPEAQLRQLAEPVPNGPSTQALGEMARSSGLTIGAGLVEAGNDGALYNTYVVAMPDGRFERHRKLHAFEHDAIRSGDSYTVFDTPYGCRVGVLICYDMNLIENARITALHGAEVILAPHQTGGCRTRNPHLMGLIERCVWDNRHTDPETIEQELTGEKGRGWLMRWLPSRAHDNGVFVVFSNGVGVDDDEIRTGNSMILDPYGRVLTETRKAGDDLITATLDGSLLEESTGRLWMQARRPELYSVLAQRTGRERDARAMKFEE